MGTVYVVSNSIYDGATSTVLENHSISPQNKQQCPFLVKSEFLNYYSLGVIYLVVFKWDYQHTPTHQLNCAGSPYIIAYFRTKSNDFLKLLR